jgi:hypothetical protein
LSSISSPGEIHSVSSHEHHLNKPVLLGGKIESSATDKKVQFAENLTTHIKDVSEEGTIKNVKPIASQSPFSGVVVEKHTNELEVCCSQCLNIFSPALYLYVSQPQTTPNLSDIGKKYHEAKT